MSRVVIDCASVEYSYGRRHALRGLTTAIGPGLVGLLGPNGAGKSTLMGLLSTTLAPQGGEVRVGGYDISDTKAIRRLLGYLPQGFELPGFERVSDVLEYAAWARGISATCCARIASQAAAKVGLEDKVRTRVRSLSGGYRQRVGIACAVIGRPQLILLDEPTVGIDPVHRVAIRRLLGEVAREATVVVATHLLEDLRLSGTLVVVIGGGRAVFAGSISELAKLGEHTADEGERPLEAGYAAVLKRAR